LFAYGILRRLLLRVSVAKPTFAALPFLWLRKMKPQFGSRRHPQPSETHRGADAVRPTTSVLRISRPVLVPPLSPRELRRYGPRGAKLRPLVLENIAPPASLRLHASPRFRPESARCLQRYRRKHSAPSHGKSRLQPTKMENSDALTVQ